MPKSTVPAILLRLSDSSKKNFEPSITRTKARLVKGYATLIGSIVIAAIQHNAAKKAAAKVLNTHGLKHFLSKNDTLLITPLGNSQVPSCHFVTSCP